MKPLIAKIGGSLFDLPDLTNRLKNWAAGQNSRRIIFVPGGGEAADVIRKLDAVHGIGQEAAHWLALRILSVNAYMMANLLKVPVVSGVDEPHSVSVLDAFEFCTRDQKNGALPHSWDVTSDSIAARVAHVASGRLVLLKSVELPPGTTWIEAAAIGLVDRAFPHLIEQ